MFKKRLVKQTKRKIEVFIRLIEKKICFAVSFRLRRRDEINYNI